MHCSWRINDTVALTKFSVNCAEKYFLTFLMEILSQVCQKIIPQSPDVSSYLMVEYSVMGVN